nr:hypothetical protein REQ54_01108 [Rhizobium sp. Q54]
MPDWLTTSIMIVAAILAIASFFGHAAQVLGWL